MKQTSIILITIALASILMATAVCTESTTTLEYLQVEKVP